MPREAAKAELCSSGSGVVLHPQTLVVGCVSAAGWMGRWPPNPGQLALVLHSCSEGPLVPLLPDPFLKCSGIQQREKTSGRGVFSKSLVVPGAAFLVVG